MNSYRVTFFKDLLSSDGHPFKCRQGTIYVQASNDAAAATSAQCQYARSRNTDDWAQFADYIEVELVKGPAEPSLSQPRH